MENWININELYSVSDLGNVKSLPMKNYNAGKRIISKKGGLLKFGTRPDGYYIVNVSGFRHRRTWKVHQLVAIHFIPNPNGYRVINHKNGIKTDNRAINLEWCTHQQNTQHSFRVLNQKPTSLFGSDNPASKKVIDNVTGEIFESVNEASRSIGMKSDTLRAMLKGRNRNKTSLSFYEQ